MGPATVRMPGWPGPFLIVGGALLLVLAVGFGRGAGPAVAASLALLGAVAFVAGLLYVAIRQIRVRRVLPPERYRGPAVLILVLLALALSFLATVPFGADATALVTGEGEITLAGSIALLVSTQLALLLVSWVFVFRPNALAGLPSLPGRNAASAVASGVGWGAAAWLGSSLVSVAVVALMEALGMEVLPQAAEQAIATVEPWLVVLSVVILAPIAEEVFFRGVVFNALRREGGRRWAYLGSSVLFAIIHLSLVAVLPLFLLGLALAWVYERTNNLLAPIAMHAVVNAISVAFALLVRFDVIRLPV